MVVGEEIPKLDLKRTIHSILFFSHWDSTEKWHILYISKTQGSNKALCEPELTRVIDSATAKVKQLLRESQKSVDKGTKL